jgi:thymidylate kinase
MLIVLRGNSGSGKTTTAKLLRELSLKDAPNQKIAVVEQDYLRRMVLKEKEKARGNNIDLIEQTALFALERGYHVILEGILRAERYELMLRKLAGHARPNYFYYFDIPFDETLKRHAAKPNSHEFGEPEMRNWFKDKDLLTFAKERIISSNQTQDEIVKTIRQDTGL